LDDRGAVHGRHGAYHRGPDRRWLRRRRSSRLVRAVRVDAGATARHRPPETPRPRPHLLRRPPVGPPGVARSTGRRSALIVGGELLGWHLTHRAAGPRTGRSGEAERQGLPAGLDHHRLTRLLAPEAVEDRL